MCPITTRTDREFYPGSPTEITLPYSCTNYPTLQELALFLQSDGLSPAGATIVGGRIMAAASKTQIETACEVP